MPSRLVAALRRHAFAIGLVIAYLWSFPYFPHIQSANELPRAYLVMAMVEDHSFAIDHEVKRWGGTADVSPSGGHQYSNKAPGSSMLAVPAYLVARVIAGGPPSLATTVWVCRVATGMIPTLLFLWLLWRFLARYAPEPADRRLLIVMYALGSMAMTYSILFISHQLSAVCIGTAWIVGVFVYDDDRDERWMLAAGFMAGAAPLVDYQAAFAGVPVAIWIVARVIQTRRWRGIVFATLGAIVPIAALLLYHKACFGSPLRTGYNASTTFAHFHQQGFLGMTGLHWPAFLGSTISADNGLVVFCPALLLALPGWVIMAQRRQWGQLAITGSVALIYLLFISSLTFWRGGWQLGPRYITVMLPFLLPPIATAVAALGTRWGLRGLMIGLVGVGVVVYAGSAAQYPHFPERFPNPLYEVTFRLYADGKAPWNAGWLLGLRGWASLVPYLAIVVALVASAALPSRRHWRSALLGAVVTGAIIGAYAAFPRGDRADDRAYRDHVAGAYPR